MSSRLRPIFLDVPSLVGRLVSTKWKDCHRIRHQQFRRSMVGHLISGLSSNSVERAPSVPSDGLAMGQLRTRGNGPELSPGMVTSGLLSRSAEWRLRRQPSARGHSSPFRERRERRAPVPDSSVHHRPAVRLTDVSVHLLRAIRAPFSAVKRLRDTADRFQALSVLLDRLRLAQFRQRKSVISKGRGSWPMGMSPLDIGFSV